MAEADVIVSTTGADRPIVDVNRFAEVRKMSGEKPVFILDLGAPRDFEPAVGELDGYVFLYDIDDLEATCAENLISFYVYEARGQPLRPLAHGLARFEDLREQWLEVLEPIGLNESQSEKIYWLEVL